MPVLILGFTLISCGTDATSGVGSPPTSAATSTTDQLEIPTTSTIPATTTTLDPEEQEWLNVVPLVVSGDGTSRFRTNVFSARFSFIPADDWTKQSETADDVTVKSSEDAPPAFLVFATRFSSIDDAVEAYRVAAECFGATMSEPTEFIVGGAPGLGFEVVGLPQRTGGACEAPISDPTGTFVAGAWRAVFRVVDVNAETVTIIFWTTPELHEDHQPSVDEMLASLVWRDLN